MPIDGLHCKICRAASLEEIPEFRALPRVTSDCLPFRDGGRLLVCRDCGAAQSPADPQWFAEIEEVYRTYSAYRQAGGAEQHVLDPVSGIFRARSQVLVERLLGLPGMPRSGDVLDVGCGTGGTLGAFSGQGEWRLCGLELDSRNLALLQGIQGFGTLYTCAPAGLPPRFSLVTMVHALEHFPEPCATLCDLRRKIVPGGRLFIEVPNADANPFDYLISDHLLHFTPATLFALVVRAGFAVDHLATNWVVKELSLIACPGKAPAPEFPPRAPEYAGTVRAQIRWLRRFVEAAREAAAGQARFGLFGSSIAATWLCSVLGESVAFFVEEDANRINRTHMDRPILSPAQVPRGSVVFIALVPAIAGRIAGRLRDSGLALRLPPS